MKNKVIDIIAKEIYDSEEAYGEINAVSSENEYKDVAERIANKLIIPFKEPSNTQWTGGVVLSTRDSPLVDCSFLVDGKIIDIQIDLRDVRNPKARNLRLDN
ncbi:hypothetical protein ACJRPK_13890 [Aquimarina sp. 2-A2]|uniref:hypothetical protein n=1 Tax=Aquimarina sp. 2-A2 TaxID=3382644 RepID=UPI00387EED5E